MHKVKRLAIFLLTFTVLLAIVAGLGSATTPSWEVSKNTDHVKVATADTTIASQLGSTSLEGSYRTKETKTTVRLAPHVSVNAIIREPVNAPANHPACLFIHGAGTGLSSQVYGDLASALASAGITTLVPDKRMDTYTTLHRDYQGMAEDYTKSLAILRTWPGVDPSKTGLYAESEGTWVSSVMTAQDPSIAFSILTSAPIYPGRRQMPMAITSYLNQIHAPQGVQAIIPKLLGMNFSPLGLEYADFNALPYWNQLKVPALLNYGTEDTSMPIEQGTLELLKRARSSNNTNVTVRYYNTNHQMRVGSQLPQANLPLDDHYTHNLEAWIGAVCQGTKTSDWATPLIAGTQPQQHFSVPAHPQPGLFKSLGTLIALLAASLIFNLLAVIGAVMIALCRLFNRSQSSMKRYRFGTHLPLLLASQGLASFLMLVACSAYIALVMVHALTLSPLSDNQVQLWVIVKALSLLPLVLLAALIEHVLNAAVMQRAGRAHLEGKHASATSGMGNYGFTSQTPIIARGWGHWIVFALAIGGSLACLCCLSFWGMYSF
ncbi:alpha/beta hydrolase family protein [Bombiscardovia coagulans]|uniref:Alpha/beta hydrolase family n=1 Tax=Bombiscardovia coagulans TaxID=686666 RepID=A0A261ETQ8_9BIFI|nr:hypothetical protein [Bombiscardovia coagulans]OZG50254.1 Alpha/beta hydrolase family [Bombiscardovia coagulans]